MCNAQSSNQRKIRRQIRRDNMKPDYKMATTKQFRDAVKTVFGAENCGKGWTDKPSNDLKSKIRYVKITCTNRTDEKIKAINFILWAQGVTANTRDGSFGFRGTCYLERETNGE